MRLHPVKSHLIFESSGKYTKLSFRKGHQQTKLKYINKAKPTSTVSTRACVGKSTSTSGSSSTLSSLDTLESLGVGESFSSKSGVSRPPSSPSLALGVGMEELRWVLKRGRMFRASMSRLRQNLVSFGWAFERNAVRRGRNRFGKMWYSYIGNEICHLK